MQMIQLTHHIIVWGYETPYDAPRTLPAKAQGGGFVHLLLPQGREPLVLRRSFEEAAAFHAEAEREQALAPGWSRPTAIGDEQL